jgi:hypothetical protein
MVPSFLAPRRMLVATDLFGAAGPTLSTAGRYAELFGAQRRVLHVVEPARFPIVVPLSLDHGAGTVAPRAHRKGRRMRVTALMRTGSRNPSSGPQDSFIRRGSP